MADANALGMATLALTQGFTQFNVMLPKISEVRKASTSEDTSLVADVRIGELAAFAGTMGVGVIVSSLSGSPLPAYVSLVTALSLIVLYESVLRSVPVERKYA